MKKNNFKEFIKTYKKNPSHCDGFDQQLKKIESEGKEIDRIKKTVMKSIDNIKNGCKAFVIYGEPQSGKTGMMIALTAKLLDEKHRIIVILLNDSVQLLEQNLERFQRADLSSAPKKFNEILSPNINLDSMELVIFSKKNANDLRKLNDKLGKYKNKIIIDDEADYATPNSKVNNSDRSKINELTGKLIGNDGIYIGVTATPARLDLNRTHGNENQSWIDFPAHENYTGQETFFPSSLENFKFKLKRLPDKGDDPIHLRTALLRFLVSVAYLNTRGREVQNYSFLVHTSGKKVDHSQDYKEIEKSLATLKDRSNKNFDKFMEKIWDETKKEYPGKEEAITEYIANNIAKSTIVVMNSDKDINAAGSRAATSPASRFTIIVGGNIVSRGVTFDNLLGMFFTRDVKNKMQQDTYIQRARMFGSRGNILKYFELTIPKELYLDWQKCFIFHRLSLESRRQNGHPVWLEDKRVRSASPSSIDKTRVSIDNGEMSFGLFDYEAIKDDINSIIDDSALSNFKKIQQLSKLQKNLIPGYLINYIENFLPAGDSSIAIHTPKTIENYKSNGVDKENITRSKGFIGNFEMEVKKYQNAVHHINILFNSKGKAKVFYKYQGIIKFLKTI